MNTLVVVAVVISGWASQYSPGVMEEVVRNRTSGGERVVQLASPPLYRPIAVRECDRLGESVRLRYGSGEWEMATVVDCARPGDGTAEWMDEEGILLEMGHRRAVELGIVGRGISVEVVRYEERIISLGERLPGPCLIIEEGIEW